MRISRRAAALALMLVAAASLGSAGPITYYLSQTVGSASVTGDVVTDGTIGVLGQANILDWTLLLHDSSFTYNLLGPLSGIGSSLFGFSGSDLSATATQLLYNFSGTDVGAFDISDGSLDFDVSYSTVNFWTTGGPGERLVLPQATCCGNFAQFTSLSGTQAIAATANTSTLINFPGGASSAPVLLAGGFLGLPLSKITGTIGGLDSQDYYTFYWAGGDFSATASISGAPNTNSSYLFSLGADVSCSSGGTATLNNSDTFNGTIGVAGLAAGQYCIGLDANDPNDPNFALTFNTPISGAVPEPSTFVLLSLGLGMIPLLRRRFPRPLTSPTSS